MKPLMQWIATLAFVAGGILLLTSPAHAQTRFTVIDQGDVNKPDIVLIPGLTSSRDVWAGEAELLAPSYRLHLVQLNGFAGQPAGPSATGEILPGVVEELHTYCADLKTKPIVMGHSLGGLLALMLAEKYPGDVNKLVIVDSLPFLGIMFGPQLTPAMIKPQVESMRDRFAQMTPEQRRANAKVTSEKLVRNPQARPLIEKNSYDSNMHVVAEAMYEDMLADLRLRLPSMQTPTLMLYPFDTSLQLSAGVQAKDTDDVYQGAYKSMPHATITRVDDSRHFIMLDQPEKFDVLVEAFLKAK